jgi:hypothetical protein
VYGTSVSQFHVGDLVELHPATDLWMRGCRYGEVTKVGRKYISVRVRNLKGRPVLFNPRDLKL